MAGHAVQIGIWGISEMEHVLHLHQPKNTVMRSGIWMEPIGSIVLKQPKEQKCVPHTHPVIREVSLCGPRLPKVYAPALGKRICVCDIGRLYPAMRQGFNEIEDQTCVGSTANVVFRDG